MTYARVWLMSFRLYWDLVMLVLLLANMITLPVAISFFNDDLSAHWIIFNGVCDTVFLTDLIINFRTGIYYHVMSYHIQDGPIKLHQCAV